MAEARAWHAANSQATPGWQHVHELLSQLDSSVAQAQRAVQAVIDHYDPLPGTLNLAYRVVDAPRPQRNVFPAACGRCGQRGAECLCEQPPF